MERMVMAMVKVFEEEEEEESDDFWSDLPLELLSLIRSYLFTERDYYIFDMVCKWWKDASKLGSLQLQFPVDYWRIQSPLLMSPNSGGYNFFHPLHHAYYMHIPEILNKKILYSKHGWLLIMGGKFGQDKQVFFFHPFTREIINLPNLSSSSSFSKFSFSGLPTGKDCVVVGIYNLLCAMEIAVIKPGEEDWRIEEYDLREEYGVAKFCSSSNPIFVDNRCYCLDADGNVGVFDPEDVENSMEFFDTGFSRRRRASLNNDGRIFILKLDKSNGNWIKM